MTPQTNRTSRLSLRLVQGGGVALLLAPLGHRLGWLGLGAAFPLAGLGFMALAIAFILALAKSVSARRTPDIAGPARVTLLLAAVLLAVPVWFVIGAAGAPAIHDITTDTESPPQFDAVVPLRGETSNPLEYGGTELAAAQRGAYPDISPLTLSGAAPDAFDRALEVVGGLGWELVDADRQEGRIEATDTTFWFGFKDDVVVRIRPASGGSRVDIRSISRVGGGDAGANANRIREFSGRLTSAPNE